MKIYFLGDVHFGVHVNSLKWLDLHRRFFYDWLIPYIGETKGPDDVLVVLGDVFENKHFLNVNILNAAMKVFEDLSKVIPIHVIAGNHDIYYLHDNEVNSVDLLRRIGNDVNVYSKDPVVKDWGGGKFLMLPWNSKPDSIENTLSELSDDHYIVAHMDIQGMHYDNSRPIHTGIGKKPLRRFKRIYSGHIHWRQEDGNILYVGTPYQTERSDRGNDKGIYVLDMDTETETFVPNDASPKYVEYTSADVMNMSIEEIKVAFHNNMVDIKWDSVFARRFNFKRFVDCLTENGVDYEELTFPPHNAMVIEGGERDTSSDFEIDEMAENILTSRGYSKSEVTESMSYFEDLNMRLRDVEKTRIK